jgi:hypothetical protein
VNAFSLKKLDVVEAVESLHPITPFICAEKEKTRGSRESAARA